MHCCMLVQGIVNNTGGSRRWLITIMVQLISTRFVIWKSVDDTHSIAYSLCDSCALCNDSYTKVKTMQVAE